MLGYPPAMITRRLAPVPSKVEKAASTVDDKADRVRASAAGSAWIWRRLGCRNHAPTGTAERPLCTCAPGEDCLRWKHDWSYMPFELLTQLFTFDELARIWFDESVCDSQLNKHFEEHEPLLWKIQNSCWRYGWDRSYNVFVRTLDAFRRIGNDLPPHFSTSITHTRAFNTAAWSAHVNSYDPKVGIYLDGPFGVLLYYKGVHVMTIGFAVSTFGVAIAQVQLRQKHGNRFLYKLGANYLDWALDFMARAFEGETLWIVDGVSNVAAIRSAYGKCADKIDEEAMTRVQRFYDQPLRDYVRVAHDGRRPGADDGRRFVKLARRST